MATLPYFGYPVWFSCPKHFSLKLFGFKCFWLGLYFIHVITETRRVEYIRYLRFLITPILQDYLSVKILKVIWFKNVLIIAWIDKGNNTNKNTIKIEN